MPPSDGVSAPSVHTLSEDEGVLAVSRFALALEDLMAYDACKASSRAVIHLDLLLKVMNRDWVYRTFDLEERDGETRRRCDWAVGA